ncbi:MAG: DUF3368 domain-containing protein [Okeania sp. SIO3I5]|uniref:DUF3368 domain-containing protein n=1 Tax=Okeania sp. SIO3I5 TaxID=2607805 RepID=UPI0013BE6C31|nr:DUF3368 domain-containing protein [Okeania sp. SIO3I5]NEQ39646.1 DUF3368 domain-containing protein [Okeania sp. SIO3I5]
MIIVSNTSPISNLAKVGQLNLLQQLYETVLIPNAVYEELLDEGAGEIVIRVVRGATWLKMQPLQNQEVAIELRKFINLGEAEAIALAFEVNATRLLINERLGRKVAIEQGLKITGVLGVLLSAKKQGLIPFVKPVMNDLIAQANFRVSSQLYAEVLRAVNE